MTATVKRRVRVVRDEDPQDPRENENIGHMVCAHRRYRLGDEQRVLSLTEREKLKKEMCVVLPLYLYDHSGITMRTSPFSCEWDSGLVGFIYCGWDKARAEYSGTDDEIVESVTRYLQGEVQEYDAYISGECYGFVIEEMDEASGEWAEVVSQWGFLGNDPKTNGILDSLHASDRELLAGQ